MTPGTVRLIFSSITAPSLTIPSWSGRSYSLYIPLRRRPVQAHQFRWKERKLLGDTKRSRARRFTDFFWRADHWWSERNRKSGNTQSVWEVLPLWYLNILFFYRSSLRLHSDCSARAGKDKERLCEIRGQSLWCGLWRYGKGNPICH